LARSIINVGAAANDGDGDTLRSGGTKINANFRELYIKLGGDSNALMSYISFTDSAMQMSDSAYTLTLGRKNLNSNETIDLPSLSGVVVLDTATQTLTNKTLTSATLTTPVISSISNTGTLTLPTSTDTLVGRATTDTLTNKTLTSPSIITPKITTAINDANSNELIKITATSSAVNEFTVANAATGNGPTLSATGGDTNVNINIDAKGTGSVEVSKLAVASHTLTADGAASLVYGLTIGNKGSSLAVTLANGTTVGEIKYFVNIGAGTMTVTPTSFGQGTSFALAQYDGCTAIWQGSNWYLVGNQGEVTVS